MGGAARVFISYASEDAPAALDFHDRLVKAGHAPWIDKQDILGGQEWKVSILSALDRADAVVVLLSPRALDKRGFLQREITEALDRAKEMLPEDPFLIPVRLEPCECPARLRHRQYIDLFEPDGFSRVLKSIAVNATARSKAPPAERTEKVRMRTLGTRSDTIPRYRVAVTYPEVAGLLPAGVETRLNTCIETKARELLADIREGWVGRLEDWNIAEDGEDRGEFIAEVRATLVSESLVSLGGEFTADPARAVHPSHKSLGWTWRLPTLTPVTLGDVFDASTSWKELVRDFCFRELSRQAELEDGPTDSGWIGRGVDELFSADGETSFCLTAENFVFVFDPYVLGPYGWGTRSVFMPFRCAHGYLAEAAPGAIPRRSEHIGL